MRVAEGDVDTAGVVMSPGMIILVLPRGSLDATVMHDANVMLSAAAAE